ncbi:hypothetical protein [Streptomyces gilvus]|uniref:hypothetical protein n=1 Tax=Streptomyces gilvus TaxID=2920937 RepID=UPI0035A831BC
MRVPPLPRHPARQDLHLQPQAGAPRPVRPVRTDALHGDRVLRPQGLQSRPQRVVAGRHDRLGSGRRHVEQTLRRSVDAGGHAEVGTPGGGLTAGGRPRRSAYPRRHE